MKRQWQSGGGSQYLYLNENVPLLRHRQFYPTDMASLAWPTSSVGKTLWKCVDYNM